jgi:hypothetical protein
LNLRKHGIADNEETTCEARRAVPRMIASLVVAFFAYLGLAAGGGFGSPLAATNGFSSGKSSQPLYLSLRDAARSMVAPERSFEPKGAWHDGNAALMPVAPLLPLAEPMSPRGYHRQPALAASLAFKPYFARGPPSSA